MSIKKCKACQHVLGDDNDPSVLAIMKCPECGSTEFEYQMIVDDIISIHENVKGKSNKLPGKKKPGTEFVFGDEISRKTGKWIEKTRIINRIDDEYYEKVEDPMTGDILHECDELLSNHRGHGSDKTDK